MNQLTEEQRAAGIADDLPYRIVEEMGLGLTFRSCTCGQLPCARLRPLRDALETVRRDAATAMRDACVEKVSELGRAHRAMAAKVDSPVLGELQMVRAEECDEIGKVLASLTLDQVQEKRH